MPALRFQALPGNALTGRRTCSRAEDDTCSDANKGGRKLPDGLIAHRVPYNSLMIALRIGVLPGDDGDLKKVLGLQEKFALRSLSNWGDPKKFGKADAPKLRKRPNYKGELAFFQTVADLLIENPPTKQHMAAVELLSRAGIVVGQPFDPEKLDLAGSACRANHMRGRTSRAACAQAEPGHEGK